MPRARARSLARVTRVVLFPLFLSFLLPRMYKYIPFLTLLHWTLLARILRNAVGCKPGLRKRRAPLTFFPWGENWPCDFSLLTRRAQAFDETVLKSGVRRECSRGFPHGERHVAQLRAITCPRAAAIYKSIMTKRQEFSCVFEAWLINKW